MKPVDELLKEYELAHGNLCPGQVLGIRMAALGCSLIGIQDPHDVDRQKLIVWIEIDRWLARRGGGGHGCKIGQTNLEVSRLREAGSHLLERRDQQGRTHSGAGVVA